MCVKTVVCMLCTKLNTCLYHLYLQCTNQWHTTWNHTQTTTNEKLSIMNDQVYQTLSKKISSLRTTACKDTNYQHKYTGYTRHSTSTFKFCSRVQNLAMIRLSCEEPDMASNTTLTISTLLPPGPCHCYRKCHQLP